MVTVDPGSVNVSGRVGNSVYTNFGVNSGKLLTGSKYFQTTCKSRNRIVLFYNIKRCLPVGKN